MARGCGAIRADGARDGTASTWKAATGIRPLAGRSSNCTSGPDVRWSIPPIRLTIDQRRIGGQALVEKLLEIEVELLDLSLNDIHDHLLARFPDKRIRGWLGLAKKHASWALSKCGLKGTVWARKCHPTPIEDREHQLNVFEYIKDHVTQGAWVWTFREGLYWLRAGVAH